MRYKQSTGYIGYLGSLSINCSYITYASGGCTSNYGRRLWAAYKLTNCQKGNYINYTITNYFEL